MIDTEGTHSTCGCSKSDTIEALRQRIDMLEQKLNIVSEVILKLAGANKETDK